ncbi:hypothetical protein G6011_09343 [Alternaria panax]|uniref:Rhodopsin domain-containing protein n=1 Tax=Alternaria panax TaxID=48097 RepID=A0AAD4IAU4_9PLEO|nr:hypothetical protein G6011_09343 [Alternaria panax]
MGLTTLQPLAYAVAYVTFFLGTSSTLLRFYCRHFVLRTRGWDENFAILILFFSIGQQVVLHMFLYWGCGLHMETLSDVQQLEIVKWLFIEEVVYYSVHWVIKSAFLLFYLRLSPSKTFRTAVYVGGALNLAILIINVMLACFQCIPFDEILHPGTHPDAICISKLVLLKGPSVLNILEDFYILILPISTVWKLQMSIRRKVAVLGVMAFGSSSVIIACFRLIPLMELNSSVDTSWVLGKMVIIAALEIQFAIIAVNLPSLKALWTRVAGGPSYGSADGEQSSSKQKGSKLSSLGQIVTIGSGKGLSGSRWGKKAHRGSITRLEQGVTATESEEELCRQGNTPLRTLNLAQEGELGAIKVTRDYDVKSTREAGDESTSKLFPEAL